MIYPSLYIAQTQSMGRGVFTSEDLGKGIIIEKSPVLVMNWEQKRLVNQTLLHDYIFDWGEKKEGCCLGLGYIALYNHSYRSNCEYEMDFENETILIKTVHYIKAGEELFINYNGNWNDEKRVWFDVK